MSDNPSAKQEQEPALGMSDEDFGNLNTAFIDEPEDKVEEAENTEQEEQTAAEAEGTPEGGDEGEGKQEAQSQEEETEQEDPEQEEQGEEDEGEEEREEPEEGEEEEEKEDGEEKEEEPDAATEAQKFFDQVTAPFKANGQQMQIKDPDDVIRLMQMGANYNKKMAGLKPSLKIVKMLERNKLLDEDRLSFLIDLDKKDPTAIAKLVKDSELDPMDLDLEEGSKYKSSKKYSVDDREMALDNVIEELKDSPTYPKTLDLVSNKWDDDSRNIVANTPELMRVIDDHMSNGVYDVISTEVEKERALGRLNGLSDIQAYQKVGDSIEARGGFAHLFKTEQKQEQAPKVDKPINKTDNAEARKAKRNAARPSKAAPTSAPKQSFNPLGMSDEEFMKDADNRLL